MKKHLENIVVILFTFIIPWRYLGIIQDDYKNIEFRQYLIFTIMFIGAAILTYSNWRQGKITRFSHFFYKIIGLCGLIFSGLILVVLFALRKGVGF